MVCVVVERDLSPAVSPADAHELDTSIQARLQEHGIRKLHSFLSSDGTRLTCVYDTGDLETVRRLHEETGIAPLRMWTARELHPPA